MRVELMTRALRERCSGHLSYGTKETVYGSAFSTRTAQCSLYTARGMLLRTEPGYVAPTRVSAPGAAFMVELMGFEPTTFCLQGRHSTSET